MVSVQKWPFFQLLFFQAIQARKMSFTIFSNEKTPFQAINTKGSKSRKIHIFLKGLTHGLGPKMAIFSTFLAGGIYANILSTSFFQAKQARKMSSTIFQNEKTPFQPIKTRSLKSRKIVIIVKSLTHGFCRKMAIFPTSFSQAKQIRKISFTIFQNEKTSFQDIKTRSSKIRKIDIFPKGVNPSFWSKNGHFSNLFFQAIQAWKMSFAIFQNKKFPFQAIKTKSSKSPNIDIFPQWLTHGFGPKMAIFSTSFFLGNIGKEKVFYDILERKNASLGYKNKIFKKSKNCHFSKGVNSWFW